MASMIPESSFQSSRTIVTSTTTPKKIIPGGIVSVKVEPSLTINGDQKSGARLVQLVNAGGSSVGVGSLPAQLVDRQPNILKRTKSATITLAPKRQMTTFVTATIPSPPSSTSSVNSETQEPTTSQQHPPPSEDFEKSPLSLLAEEAARRTPTLNLAPCISSDVPLCPKFIGGPIIMGKEQVDIRKSEIVCQQLSEQKLNGPYVVLIAHSHREYRSTMIKAENFEGFKEDNEAMRRWPLRAWTDSAYSETQYVLLDIPKLGTHPVAIVTLRDENVINLRFPVLSSDRNNHGHKKFGRLWEEIVFPYDKLKNAHLHWQITPIQIVAELRDPNKLKKPKRPDLASTLALNLPYRTNIADVAGGYFETSDDEDSRHHARLGEMIKKEPFEESESNFAMYTIDPDQLINSMVDNYRQFCESLRSKPQELQWFQRKSARDLQDLRELMSFETQSPVRHFENLNGTHGTV